MNRDEPILDGEYYHAYNRGNRRQPIFGDRSDYHAFMRKLGEASWKYRVEVVVFTLMPNHFHFVLVQAPTGSIPRLMNSIETSAAKRFDLKYRQVGHLFQGRYQYNRIQTAGSLLVAARYIHLNPVDARLVRCPEEWPYSDFAEYVRMACGIESTLPPVMNRGEGCPLPCTPKEYVEFVRSLSGLDEDVLQLHLTRRRASSASCGR